MPFRSPARPPARLLVPPLPPVRPPAGPPACLASTRPGLARPVAARLGSTWLGSGSARLDLICLGSGSAWPGLAPDRVQPGPGPAPKAVVSRRRNSNLSKITDLRRRTNSKTTEPNKNQQQCRNSAGLGLAELGPARPGPGLARLDLPGLSSAWPGPGRRSSTRLPSVQLSSARLGPARPGQAAHHPSELFRPNYGKYKLIAHRHMFDTC